MFTPQVTCAIDRFIEDLSGRPPASNLSHAIDRWLTEGRGAYYVAFDFTTWLKTVLSICLQWESDPLLFYAVVEGQGDDREEKLYSEITTRDTFITYEGWEFTHEDYFMFWAQNYKQTHNIRA